MVNKTKPEELTTIGQWSWKSDLLMNKVVQGPRDECWPWLGSTGPHSSLFGAIKNGKRQMTQACRILYRELYKKDCEEKEITHTCGNRHCVNWHHWAVKDIKTSGRPVKNTPQVKQTTMKPIKRWWDL